MPATGMKILSRKLLTLCILFAALFAFDAVVPRHGSSQSSSCDYDVYDYCWSQGRNVDPSSCTCNPNSCLGVVESDCTEQGMYLSYSDCACHGNPSYTSVCDGDPYASGCPRSFDTVFAGQMRILQGCGYPGAENDPACDPMIGGGSGDICSFESFAWCSTNGGSWSSYGCACSGVVSSGSTAQQTCTDAGGVWYNPGNSSGGGTCYNPSGIGSASQCATTSESLSSCVSSSGLWNPYTCTCRH
jgi:hypothetical protein